MRNKKLTDQLEQDTLKLARLFRQFPKFPKAKLALLQADIDKWELSVYKFKKQNGLIKK